MAAQRTPIEADPPCRQFSSVARQQLAAVRERLATPALAHAWVDAIIAYWQSGLASGTIISGKPLYLLDLAPQHGQFAWLVLGSLRQRLAEAGLALQPCYLACELDAESTATLHQHAYLRDYAAQKWFDSASFNVTNATLQLHGQGVRLLKTDNPIVVLGLACFQQLPSELVAVHNGKVLQGQVCANSDATFDTTWDAIDAQVLPQCAAPLLEHYLARCTSAALTLPLAACRLLDALDTFGAGRTLLLAADNACCTDQQIRLGALYPPATCPIDGYMPPLNVHALGLHLRRLGAWTWHQQLVDDGIALHVACHDPAHADAITAALATAHPDDQHQRLDTLANLSPGGLLAMLRTSRYDPQVLKAGIRSLLETPPALTELTRRSWQAALANTWYNYFPVGDGDLFYRDAGLLAIQLESWGLARSCFHLGLALYADNANDLYLLAYCEAATGNLERAAALLAQAVGCDSSHRNSAELGREVAARMQRHAACRGYQPRCANAAGLRLEPLGLEHAASLLYQYRDEQIGILTRLPALATDEQAQAWILEQHEQADNLSFAVMHEHWGFTGCVSIHCAGDSGYFYFWIGTDFQDLGIGQAAATLLFEMLAGRGLRHVFTSANENNRRSLHALGRLGFAILPVRAREPDQHLVFLHRGCAVEGDAVRRLRALCTSIGTHIPILDHAGAS
jgi:RimJ/RimL family protein N-acetyltransferase